MKKRRFITAVLVLILLVSAAQVGWKIYESVQRAQEYEEAAQTAGLTQEPSAPTPAPPEAPAPSGQAPIPGEAEALAAVDLAALQAVNPDVAGWIEIPGTEVSYPILYGEDNELYLNHTWTGESNSGGSIFLECTASRDLSDFHTIVYGHRMRDESMFGSIKHYNDPDYYAAHPNVYTVADGILSQWQIFSARETGVRELTYRLDLEESGLEEAFVQDCLDHSVIDTGVLPGEGARFLTLSTCTGRGYATRWVVHAALLETWPVSAQGEGR